MPARRSAWDRWRQPKRCQRRSWSCSFWMTGRRRRRRRPGLPRSPTPGAEGAGGDRGGRKTIRWIEKCHALICFCSEPTPCRSAARERFRRPCTRQRDVRSSEFSDPTNVPSFWLTTGDSSCARSWRSLPPSHRPSASPPTMTSLPRGLRARRRSLRRTCARSRTAWRAVTAEIGAAAACSKERFAGRRASLSGLRSPKPAARMGVHQIPRAAGRARSLSA